MKQRTNEKTLSVILNKIEKIPFSGCWIWTASCTANGYGQIRFNQKQTYSHRVSWILHNGEIPDGLNVLHKCDVRCCINPDHLFLGTQLENIKDMIAKGRGNHGWKAGKPSYNKGKKSVTAKEKHWKAKVTEKDVSEIRSRYLAGEAQKKIGFDYGIKQAQVSRIVRNLNWN